MNNKMKTEEVVGTPSKSNETHNYTRIHELGWIMDRIPNLSNFDMKLRRMSEEAKRYSSDGKLRYVGLQPKKCLIIRRRSAKLRSTVTAANATTEVEDGEWQKVMFFISSGVLM